jgi:PPOX class probable F420-dependent enzyme
MRLRVESARVATLGTVDADGAPHLVPVTFVLAGETVYSAIDHKPKTTQRLKRLANIRRDPRVTLLVHSYDDDWSLLWWCRLRGHAEVLDGGADDARRLLAGKYQQYRERLPSGPVIAIAIEGWTGWSAT